MADAVSENSKLDIGTVELMNYSSSLNVDGKVNQEGADHNCSFENIDLNQDGDVEDADLSEEEGTSSEVSIRPKRKIKRKRRSRSLQHSTEENESSSDSDFCTSQQDSDKDAIIKPGDLNWTMWLWYYVVAVSTGAFRLAEYLGEKLADLFGITTPKYQYVIDEYYRMKQQEREEDEREAREKQHVLQREAERMAQAEGGNPQE